jgi:hypothetical protein
VEGSRGGNELVGSYCDCKVIIVRERERERRVGGAQMIKCLCRK